MLNRSKYGLEHSRTNTLDNGLEHLINHRCKTQLSSDLCPNASRTKNDFIRHLQQAKKNYPGYFAPEKRE